MYLIDTNIFLEMLLKQDKAEKAVTFFEKVNKSKIFISDFTIYSIGITLHRLKKADLFLRWIDDIIRANIGIIRLNLHHMQDLSSITSKFNFDFDDAYQYAVAEKHNLQIISFDKDFDRTTRGRKEPSEVVK
jgi:predicted nucleic acid-binding protein